MKNMKNYKVGDKFVIEIDKVFSQDGETLYRVKGMKSLVFDEYELNILEPLSAYTDLLETKIRRQASHITYLEGKIKELKSDLKHGRTIEDDCDSEAKRAAGQQKAWELAQKIIAIRGYSLEEIEGIFGTRNARECLLNYTYTEAAAKVAEWEKATIKRGDEVEKNDLRDARFIVTFTNGKLMSGVTQSGLVFSNEKTKDWHKTGRHIDIDGFLKQIRGECE